MRKTQLWIADQWVDAADTVALHNPHTGEMLAEIGYASVAQAELAIEAAARAYETFRQTPVHERAEILSRVSRMIEQRAEEAARIIAAEAAKPIRAARSEIKR